MKFLPSNPWVVALTTSVIVLAVEPLSNRIFDVVANLSTGYTDQLYESASLGVWPVLDIWVLWLIFAVLTGLYIGALIDTQAKKYIPSPDEKVSQALSLPGLIVARVIGGVALGFLLLAIVLPVYLDVMLNAGFERRITALAPHIDEQSEEELRALWSTMKSRDDHVHLNNQLEMHASQAEITLPDTLRD